MLRQHLADAEKVINDLKARENDLTKRSKSEITDLTNKLTDSNNELEELEFKYEELVGAHDELQANFFNDKVKISNLAAKLAEADSANKVYVEKNKKLHARIAELQLSAASEPASFDDSFEPREKNNSNNLEQFLTLTHN